MRMGWHGCMVPGDFTCGGGLQRRRVTGFYTMRHVSIEIPLVKGRVKQLCWVVVVWCTCRLGMEGAWPWLVAGRT